MDVELRVELRDGLSPRSSSSSYYADYNDSIEVGWVVLVEMRDAEPSAHDTRHVLLNCLHRATFRGFQKAVEFIPNFGSVRELERPADSSAAVRREKISDALLPPVRAPPPFEVATVHPNFALLFDPPAVFGGPGFGATHVVNYRILVQRSNTSKRVGKQAIKTIRNYLETSKKRTR